MLDLQVAELGPELAGGLQRGTERTVGEFALPCLLAPRLEDQGADQRGKRRRVEIVPGAAAQALGHQQVAFAVDAAQRTPRRGHGDHAIRCAEIAQFEEHIGHSIENLRHRTGAPTDLRAQLIGLPLEPPPALGPARVCLSVAAALARVSPHAFAEFSDAPLTTIPIRSALAVGASAATLGPSVLLLQVGQLAPQPRVLLEITEMAVHRLGVLREGRLLLAYPPRHVNDGAIGLELGEGTLEDLAGAISTELLDQVDRHVVRRTEARDQRVAPPRRQRGHRCGIEPRRPLDDRVPLHVDPPTAGPASELRVLARRDRHSSLAVELLELLEHDGARRHVHAKRQRLCGEDHLQQLPLEQLLDDLFERRQHARVMGRDATLQTLEPFPIAQDAEILVRDAAAALFDDCPDLLALGPFGESDV